MELGALPQPSPPTQLSPQQFRETPRRLSLSAAPSPRLPIRSRWAATPVSLARTRTRSWSTLACQFHTLLYVSESALYAELIPSLVKEESNVIIRNLGISKVLADNGDAIGIREFPSCNLFP